MKDKALLLIGLMLWAVNAFAYAVEVDGIFYDLDKTATTATSAMTI